MARNLPPTMEIILRRIREKSFRFEETTDIDLMKFKLSLRYLEMSVFFSRRGKNGEKTQSEKL